MWAEGKTLYDRNFRHVVRQDELDHFEWIRNDGRSFGIEELTDTKADAVIEASFNIPSPSVPNNDVSWTQHFSVSKSSNKASLPFLFYLGLDCDLPRGAKPCFSVGTDVHSLSIHPAKTGSDVFEDVMLVGYSSLTGWFGVRYVVQESSHDTTTHAPAASPSPRGLSFWGVGGGISGMGVVVDEIKASSSVNVERANAVMNKRKRRGLEGPPPEGITGAVFDIKTGALPNEIAADAIGVVAQVLSKKSFDLTVAFRSEAVWQSAEDVLRHFTETGTDTAGIDLRTQHLQALEAKKEAFDVKFEQQYQMGKTEEVLSHRDREIARRCLSNLLGGLGYFHGEPVIGDSYSYLDAQREGESGAVSPSKLSTPQTVPARRLTLFSGTPSRSSFPRGFLWDEGFHQMAISTWDATLTMDVLKHWLGVMLQYTPPSGENVEGRCPGGWIPRELILGEEATRAVPQEFVTQRVDVANPPTLLMAVEGLLHRAKRGEVCVSETGEMPACSGVGVDATGEELALREFLQESFTPLHRWVQWLVHSQAGPTGWHRVNGKNVSTLGTFRWRGRREDKSRLMTNTLASGLDDYPRSAVASEDEFHVDLLSWIIKSLDIMRQLKDFLQLDKDGASDEYAMYSSEVVTQHIEQMVALHWSEEMGTFADVGLIGSSEQIDAELTIRCKASGNRRGYVDIPVKEEALKKAAAINDPDSLCPRQFREFVSPHGDGNGNLLRKMVYSTPGKLHLGHIPRVGYVSIFPLLLCVLPPSSSQLPRLLDVLESPDHLWSDHGLRSISTRDLFYKQENAPGDAPYWRYHVPTAK